MRVFIRYHTAYRREVQESMFGILRSAQVINGHFFQTNVLREVNASQHMLWPNRSTDSQSMHSRDPKFTLHDFCTAVSLRTCMASGRFARFLQQGHFMSRRADSLGKKCAGTRGLHGASQGPCVKYMLFEPTNEPCVT